MKTILLSDSTMKQYTEATGQKLTFKEKLKSFFFTPGVIIALVMFFLTVLINLIPMS